MLMQNWNLKRGVDFYFWSRFGARLVLQNWMSFLTIQQQVEINPKMITAFWKTSARGRKWYFEIFREIKLHIRPLCLFAVWNNVLQSVIEVSLSYPIRQNDVESQQNNISATLKKVAVVVFFDFRLQFAGWDTSLTCTAFSINKSLLTQTGKFLLKVSWITTNKVQEIKFMLSSAK